ncbi:MAG: pentapeptide repeat-containing protein [Deltaproteobacteria bacterium]|nr:pentapeptide repeat-containing protein [Deltaproteobacteria bacterium]
MRIKPTWIILSLLLLLPTLVLAFNSEDLKKLKQTKSCVNCDLSGADLKGVNLVLGDLSGSSFKNANLEGANLHEAKVDGADFSGAILSGASWIDGCQCEYDSIGECLKF